MSFLKDWARGTARGLAIIAESSSRGGTQQTQVVVVNNIEQPRPERVRYVERTRTKYIAVERKQPRKVSLGRKLYTTREIADGKHRDRAKLLECNYSVEPGISDNFFHVKFYKYR